MKKSIFIVAVAVFTIVVINQLNSKNSNRTSLLNIENMETQIKHDTLAVQGKCGMCKTRIEKAAKSVKGVSSATWDLKTMKLQVDYDPAKTSVEAVSKAIAQIGHDTEKDKANQKTYDALPACCKYRS